MVQFMTHTIRIGHNDGQTNEAHISHLPQVHQRLTMVDMATMVVDGHHRHHRTAMVATVAAAEAVALVAAVIAIEPIRLANATVHSVTRADQGVRVLAPKVIEDRLDR